MSYREVLASVAAQKIRAPQPSGEINWKSSMLFCQTLSDAIEKYGTDELPANFPSVIEPFINSILECAISERTQLSVQACRAIGSLPKVLAKDMHPLIDRILPVLFKHCASTKTVNQKSATSAIANIVTYSTYSPRLLYHVCAAFEDKNVGPRSCATGLLQLMLQTYHKSLVSDRDHDAVAQSITSALLDADNNVRTKARAVFWEYYKIDPAGADEIKTKLNTHAITALDNDPSNPEKKSDKSRGKKSADADSALAKLRQQRKKQMMDRAAQQEREVAPPSATSADSVAGKHDVGDSQTELRSKKSFRDDNITQYHKQSNHPAQNESHHMAKPASRPIAVHKKGLSQDGPVQQLSKKPSSADVGSQAAKKTGSADGLRTSQNRKPIPPGPINEPHNARSLLSAPVRRPRIIATPINTQSTSRPSSRADQRPSSRVDQRPSSRADQLPPHRADHAPLNTYASDANLRATKEHTAAPAHKPTKMNVGTDAHSELAHRPAPLKASKKLTRPEISSPVMIPDGKENAILYPSAKVAKAERIPSPTRKPLELSQQRAEIPQQEHGSNSAEAAAAAAEQELRSARRALLTALDLLKNDSMDYMGFRKLKNLICTFGRDLIVDKNHYDDLMKEILSRLGSVTELVYRGDPSDARHPTYIRQAILHMIYTLLQSYHPAWTNDYMGPALAAMMLARCTYSPNIQGSARERPVAGQPYMSRNSTVELITESMDQVIHFCPNPLDVLDSILDALASGETFIMDHASDAQQVSLSADSTWRTAAASYDRYSKEERMRVERFRFYQAQPNSEATPLEPAANQEGPTDAEHDMPSKMPFLMETALKLITPLIEKARNMGQNLYPAQEDLLGDLGQHLLRSYSALIRRQVMPFCEQLYLSYESEDGFWEHFQQESDRNLLHYYLADVRR